MRFRSSRCGLQCASGRRVAATCFMILQELGRCGASKRVGALQRKQKSWGAAAQAKPTASLRPKRKSWDSLRFGNGDLRVQKSQFDKKSSAAIRQIAVFGLIVAISHAASELKPSSLITYDISRQTKSCNLTNGKGGAFVRLRCSDSQGHYLRTHLPVAY